MADLWVNPLHLRHEVANIPYVAAGAEGDAFDNGGHDRILFVDNRSGAARTVAVDKTFFCNLGGEHRFEYEIQAGQSRIIGPFSPPCPERVEIIYPKSADGLYVAVVAALNILRI